MKRTLRKHLGLQRNETLPLTDPIFARALLKTRKEDLQKQVRAGSASPEIAGQLEQIEERLKALPSDDPTPDQLRERNRQIRAEKRIRRRSVLERA